MAALASPRHPQAPVQQLTPPRSARRARASWDLAVPLDHTSAAYHDEPYMSQYPARYASGQPHTVQANAFAHPVPSPTWDSLSQSYENDGPDYSSERATALHKKPTRDMNTISKDPDSVLEYYKNHTNKKSAPAAAKAKPKKKTAKGAPGDPNWVAVEHDDNNWIHRDKLKEIETKELEAAGFRVGGRSSGANSRSQSATRKRSRDRRGSEAAGHNQSGDDRAEGRRVVSSIPAADEESLEQDQPWRESTTFEELAAGGGQPASPRTTTHNGRPSTSRIPLPKTSGIPVSAAAAERDAPRPRSGASSGNWNGDAMATNGARVRSGSVSSQHLLDEPEDDQRTTPPYEHARKPSAGSPPKSPQKSPIKAKTPAKAGPPGTRKTSVKTQSKGRNVSGTSPPKRPGTSGAVAASRPVTSHKPEGEAPWLATMYKPDPRLPPDQQIIPTHAKRMQQEQWENEGRVGSMYDKDFRLLNTEDMDGKRLSQIDPIALEKQREDGEWPLPSPDKQALLEPPSEKTDTSVNKTQANEQGGAYKLTPTIPQSPRFPPAPHFPPSPPVPVPKLAPPIEPPAPHPRPRRLPEPVDEDKEKKACCCIVM
ncbi:40S ribosomal protein S12 [Pleosporales sp. CAS-2024a]